MSAKLLEGKIIAESPKVRIKAEVEGLKAKTGRVPKLTALQIDENTLSAIYVKAQKKAAEALGLEYELVEMPLETSQEEAEEQIKKMNNDGGITAIMLQLPVPNDICAKKLVNLISPAKDAEGMTPENLGHILLGDYKIAPCTAMAVGELLESTKVDLYGKEAVIVGHSAIVGKPLSLILLKFFNVFGPNEYHKGRMASVVLHAYNQISKTGMMKLFRSHRPDFKDGMQLRDFVYVKDVVNVLYFLMETQKQSGLYNVGTGKARAFLDLTKATFKGMDKGENIEFVDTPVDIRDKYQYFTEANMDKLHSVGYDKAFYSLEEGVEDYVRNYISKQLYY